MSWFLAATPALALYGSGLAIGDVPCKPEPFVWQPPGYVFLIVWTFLAVSTGITAYNLPMDNDAIAAFTALILLLGLGYVVNNTMCTSTFALFYLLATVIASVFLWTRLNKLASDGDGNAPRARDWLWPLIGWLLAALLYTILAAGYSYYYGVRGGKKGRARMGRK